MRLYVTPSGRWAGTQAAAVAVAREADAGRWTQFEVPTDKPGLLAFLDERRVRAEAGLPDDLAIAAADSFDTIMDRVDAPPAAAPVREPLAVAPDGAKVALITVEEFIQNADAGQLASVANNVCWRIKELAKALQP
jgi:hypothetical protein